MWNQTDEYNPTYMDTQTKVSLFFNELYFLKYDWAMCVTKITFTASNASEK